MQPKVQEIRGWMLQVGLTLAALAPAASATDLKLSATSGGQSSVIVAPGAAVPWAVTGELTDNANQGLAMFAFDLAFSGGALSPAPEPASQPMLNFSSPLGCSNPAGFGGTPVAGSLVQVGGAQNTIGNFFAPLPVGNVVTGVAAQGAPQLLAAGTLAAPLQVGTYTLSIGNVMANVIRTGSTSRPFWAVDGCDPGAITNLQVSVVALKSHVATLDVKKQDVQRLSLDAGTPRAGRPFWLLGTTGGSVPGLALPGGQHLPLNPSAYLNHTLAHPNTQPLANSLGSLDGNGRATSTFTLPHVPPAAAGLVITHAYVLLQPVDFASNAVEVTLVP